MIPKLTWLQRVQVEDFEDLETNTEDFMNSKNQHTDNVLTMRGAIRKLRQ